jgi:hypothetical protein
MDWTLSEQWHFSYLYYNTKILTPFLLLMHTLWNSRKRWHICFFFFTFFWEYGMLLTSRLLLMKENIANWELGLAQLVRLLVCNLSTQDRFLLLAGVSISAYLFFLNELTELPLLAFMPTKFIKKYCYQERKGKSQPSKNFSVELSYFLFKHA